MNRRKFLLLSAAAAVTASENAGAEAPGAPSATSPSGPSADTILDAGPLSGFNADQVYADFREQGFFLIRREKKLFALSSICTHKGCKVRPQTDGSFLCKCHKSTFDRDGKVTKGPATRNLPRLGLKENEQGHVLVNTAVSLPT